MNKSNIRFCHIAPTPHLYLTEDDPMHMVLGHLVQDEMGKADKPYTSFYRNRKHAHGCELLMDNSAFEIVKHGANGGKFYSAEQMIEIGSEVDADILVMTDYPGQDSRLTVDSALEQGPKFKEAGFKTMFVPQSEIGDLEGWLDAVRWAVTEGRHLVDLIGFSILGVPNALGNIEKGNKLQRFLARWHMMSILDEQGLLEIMKENGQGFHALGALDGWVGEIMLMMQSGFDKFIYSWDTSSAVWAGLNGIQYDHSPTGLINGKLETEVDFSKDFDDGTLQGSDAVATAAINVGIINNLTTQTMVR